MHMSIGVLGGQKRVYQITWLQFQVVLSDSM